MNIKALLGKDPRTQLMRKNMAVSALLKIWTGVIYLALVPLTLRCLGTYHNGIWLTISAMLMWIDNLDIGLGNGLRNQLAIHLAHGDRKQAQQVVTSTFFMLIMIIVPVALITVGMTYSLDIFSFMNVDPALSPDLRHAVATALLFVCATFIFKFIGNFYMGLQLPAASNFIIALGQTLVLLATIVAWLMGCHSLVVIAAINTCSPLLIYLLAYPYTFHNRYPDLRPKASAFSWKHEAVNPFQICYRYFSIPLMFFNIISAPIWSATTDAYARNEEQWIRDCRRRMDSLLLFFPLVLILMIAISQPVYHIWLQDQVKIPFLLNVLMAVYIYLIMYSLSYCYFLNGIGALTLQLIFTTLAALALIPLTLLLHHWMGNIYSVVIAMIIVNTPGLTANHVQFYRIINHKARGIWLQ